MTLKGIVQYSSKFFDHSSKKEQRRKRKRLNTSNGNLFALSKHLPNPNEEISLPIMTVSDLSRSISNRSITFASVFDGPDVETNNQPPLDHDSSLDNEDLVIIVPNKYVLDEPIIPNSNTEPYPFRSQIPLCSLSKITRPSYSKRKSHHPLVRYHRAKKLSQPINRPESTPNLSSTTTDHPRSLKTIRQWFKSSSFGRLIQSFIKHPTTANPKPPMTPRKCFDLIY